MLKEELGKMLDALHGLEDGARKLQNQNFADIVRSAAGRVHQLTQHPDLDRVQHEVDPSKPAGVQSSPTQFPGQLVERASGVPPGGDSSPDWQKRAADEAQRRNDENASRPDWQKRADEVYPVTVASPTAQVRQSPNPAPLGGERRF